MRDSVKMIGAAAVGLVLGVVLMSGKRTVEVPGLLELYEGRVLVGQGCVGARGPGQIMLGFEEDEFTQCDTIDVHRLE